MLIYTLMRGNADNWRNNTATFSIEEYMAWAGLKSRDAAYRQLKKDMQAITGMKITAESFKKYFESFYITHLATEAYIKKYTGEVHISFAENVRHFLTQYYQLIPDWMGHLSENSYRLPVLPGQKSLHRRKRLLPHQDRRHHPLHRPAHQGRGQKPQL